MSGEPFGRQLTGLTANWVDELYGMEEKEFGVTLIIFLNISGFFF